ncbi:MAG: hypothetical protein DRI86_15005 [Bacteroidetes bacterium]|nr:MAG: hypothetical protein DRI86_15005 [Bacteroidota bacterium]
MNKMILKLSLCATVAIGFSGCAYNVAKGPLYSYQASNVSNLSKNAFKISDVVSELTEELVSNLTLTKKDIGAIAITSFVQLDKLNRTTHFGRVIGESFFNELHSKGLNVMDFRGQKFLSINANGEFFITRDVKKLATTIENSYVLVGTYAQIEEGVLINARIIDNINGKVVASSRVVYHSNNCEIFENCKKSIPKKVIVPVVRPIRTINITTDHCSKVECPTNCPTGTCK